MKTMVMGTVLILMTAAAPAASIVPVQVGASAISCVFKTNCTNLAEESSSSFTLPGAVGAGFLHTRVILGESNSPAAGLFGYEYRIDLSGVTLDPAVPPCVTNVLRCLTNRVDVSLTNVVVCRTNTVGARTVLNCVTNRIPGTNIVTCVTNTFPATNIVACHVTAAGATVCFTNSFAATNYVLCFTNRVPDRSIVTCQTNRLTGSNVVVCATNNVRYHTNIVTCTTNTVPCPVSTPCITTLRIQFGPAVAMDFDTNGSSRDKVYLVSSGGLGSNAPAAITLEDGKLVLRFSPPLCPGDSSLSVGLVSRGAPRDLPATLKVSSGGKVLAMARAPQVVQRIDCDFSKLAQAIHDLRSRDILASNNGMREARRTALLNLVRAAQDAAEAGNAEEVMAALAAIVDKTDGGRNDWLTPGAAHKVNKILADISKCLVDDEKHHDGDKDNNDNKDDEDDKDDDRGHGR